MHGKIHVESEKWKGSEFTFTIKCPPLTNEDENNYYNTLLTSTNVSTQIRSPIPMKILIVEDEKMNQLILSRFLKAMEQNINFEVAGNGQEAIEKYNEGGFNLIFMDIQMPVMDGLTATKKIREMEKNSSSDFVIPIVGLSGDATQIQLQMAKDAGMTDYASKPYLKSVIEKMINKHVIEVQKNESSSAKIIEFKE